MLNNNQYFSLQTASSDVVITVSFSQKRLNDFGQSLDIYPDVWFTNYYIDTTASFNRHWCKNIVVHLESKKLITLFCFQVPCPGRFKVYKQNCFKCKQILKLIRHFDLYPTHFLFRLVQVFALFNIADGKNCKWGENTSKLKIIIMSKENATIYNKLKIMPQERVIKRKIGHHRYKFYEIPTQRVTAQNLHKATNLKLKHHVYLCTLYQNF